MTESNAGIVQGLQRAVDVAGGEWAYRPLLQRAIRALSTPAPQVEREAIARVIRRAMLDNPIGGTSEERAAKRAAIATEYADAYLADLAIKSEDFSAVADLLDDIETDSNGMCRWADVANAQTNIRAALRCVLALGSRDEQAIRAEKCAYEIIDNGKTNPLIVISPDQVQAWLRSIADAAGYADRASSAVQVKAVDCFGEPTIRNGLPEIVLMVSNVPHSRPPAAIRKSGGAV